MFDNLGTAFIQAIGFLVIFAFFVYQILFLDKSSVQDTSKKLTKSKNEKIKPTKKGFFNRKVEPPKEELKPKKRGLFRKK